MNYNKYRGMRRRELIKNTVFITVIMLFAIFTTYNIYNLLREENVRVRNLKSLDVVFHEKEGEMVSLTKMRPVTDAVGLSSHAYTFTIKNNTNTRVNYDIKIVSDNDTIKKDKCASKKMPLNIIKCGIHKKGKVSKIYNLDDLENGVIESNVIGPQKEESYVLRFWISKNSLMVDEYLHFHGKIVVLENGTLVSSL